MRAAVCRVYGPPEGIEIEEVPAPALLPGQVRVRVDAAAVNFPDVLLMANDYQVEVPAPFIPGSEFAGVVTEAGADVAGFAIGDRVFGSTLFGAFAEEIVVGAHTLTQVPEALDQRSAAALGVSHRTAYHVLRSVASLQPGEELVVIGAGGGVGLAAVQLGAILGAQVTAVASTAEKLEVAAAHGAARGVEHRAGDLRQALRQAVPDGTDVVIDPVGGELAEPALRSLRFGGRFVTVGYASGVIPRIPLNLVLLKGIHILGFQLGDFASHRPDELHRNEGELLELVAAGRARPHVCASFGLGEAAAALRYVADGRAIGKVVLELASSSEEVAGPG